MQMPLIQYCQYTTVTDLCQDSDHKGGGRGMGEIYRTDWKGVPHTNRHAIPVEFEYVRNTDVIYVEKAAIRDAVVEKAHFEIANTATVGDHFHGKPSVEVRCLWYGCKPTTTWMHLTLLGKWKVIPRYSGKVIRNIGPLAAIA
jgi:hypothetical protein